MILVRDSGSSTSPSSVFFTKVPASFTVCIPAPGMCEAMVWLTTASFSTNHDSFPQYHSQIVLEAKMPDATIQFFKRLLTKYPWIIFLRRKMKKKEKKRTSHWWKPTELHLPNQQDWTLRETRYTSAFQAKRGTDIGTCATFSCVGKPWWGMRQMNCQTVSLQGTRQKWEYCLPNSERDIMASQRSISPSSLYPLLLLHTSLPLASLLPASSFCVQCCRVSWESERMTPCSLPHIEWSSSASKSTCKCMVWLLKQPSSRSVWCPQEFNGLRMCRQQCSVISKVLL